MDNMMKTAAENLLKIAEELEEKTLKCTYFVCDSCNHTANLASINKIRKEAAEQFNVQNTKEITVNDTLSCAVPGCEGTMSYVATEESGKYWVDAADEEEVEDILEEEPGKKEEDTPFEPVDEQDKKKEDDAEGIDIGFGEEDEIEEKNTEEKPEEPEDKMMTEEDMEKEEAPKKEKPKQKKDKPDDGKASLPKKDTPKFEKMPKEAGMSLEAAIERYSIIPQR